MVGKAVNNFEIRLIRWALIIALAGRAAGVCSGRRGRRAAGEPSPHMLRYSPAPLDVRMPPPAAPVKPQVVFHGDRSRKQVALTFDACATKMASGYDEEVIRVLIETGTPATLFLGGKWMLEHPDQVAVWPRSTCLSSEPLVSAPAHDPDPGRSGAPGARMDPDRHVFADREAGIPLSPPYGEQDERTARIAAEAGLITVQFDLASGDPDAGLSRERIVRSVTEGARSGSIVVMHVNGRGWKTAEALPDIIGELRRKGFRLVTVGEMLRGGRGSVGD